MKLAIVIAAMVGSTLLMTPAHAADTEKHKSKPQMQQKQPDKDMQKNDRVVPGGSVGEERTGGPGTSGTAGEGNGVTVPPPQGAKKKP